MKKILSIIGVAFIAWMAIACTSDVTASNEAQEPLEETKEMRIVSLSGTITELLFECGMGDKLVGVDVTSTYPEAAQELTNLGHTRQLNAEAILALKPTMILVDEQNAENKVLETIRNAGIDIHAISIPQQLDGILTAVKELETITEKTIDTKELADKIANNTAAIEALKAAQTTKPKVLFIYARGAQTMMVAGTNTFAEKMIEIAGGESVVKEFESFKPLTPEALIQYQPDAILMFTSGLESLADETQELSGAELLFGMPGMEQTPAGKNKKVITMDGLYLSGFGPRSSDAALELAKQLYPKADNPTMK